jgi:hypothetical protein
LLAVGEHPTTSLVELSQYFWLVKKKLEELENGVWEQQAIVFVSSVDPVRSCVRYMSGMALPATIK